MFFTAGADGRFCFYKIPEFPDEVVVEHPQTVMHYGELPKINYPYWSSLCMHGKEGENKIIAITMGGNDIILIDSINCKVLSSVKVKKDQ
jgi:hypothetical protein